MVMCSRVIRRPSEGAARAGLFDVRKAFVPPRGGAVGNAAEQRCNRLQLSRLAAHLIVCAVGAKCSVHPEGLSCTKRVRQGIRRVTMMSVRSGATPISWRACDGRGSSCRSISLQVTWNVSAARARFRSIPTSCTCVARAVSASAKRVAGWSASTFPRWRRGWLDNAAVEISSTRSCSECVSACSSGPLRGSPPTEEEGRS